MKAIIRLENFNELKIYYQDQNSKQRFSIHIIAAQSSFPRYLQTISIKSSFRYISFWHMGGHSFTHPDLNLTYQ